MIAAPNGHLLALDNLSGLPGWISDALYRLATGGSFAVRQLYTDAEEVLFEAACPILLNGIEDVVNRPDPGDRTIFVTLPHIPGKPCGTCSSNDCQAWRVGNGMPASALAGWHVRARLCR